jgi:hypothetical protein
MDIACNMLSCCCLWREAVARTESQIIFQSTSVRINGILSEAQVSLLVWHILCSLHMHKHSPAPTESPKRSPRTFLPTVKGFLPACPTSAAARTASSTPGAGCFSQATPCQGRAGGVGYGVGALVLALTGVAYLRTRTGGSI